MSLAATLDAMELVGAPPFHACLDRLLECAQHYCLLLLRHHVVALDRCTFEAPPWPVACTNENWYIAPINFHTQFVPYVLVGIVESLALVSGS